MSGVFKVSEAAAIGLHAAVYLAAHPGRACRAREMAEALKASEAHLVKVLQRLARAGIMEAVRGPKGGFTLSRPAAEVSLGDVFEAIDGKLKPFSCLLKHRACDGRLCILGGMVKRVNQEALDYLTTTKLSELITAYGKRKNNKES